jgi:raffinose/stachyose/melibiose transport system permease protein
MATLMQGTTTKSQLKRQRKPLWRRMRDHIWGYIFLTPFVILVSTFVIYPIFGSIRYAFYNWDGFSEPTEFVGMRHFITVAGDKFFWNAFWNTVTYAVVLVPIQLFLALVLAMVLNNPKLRFSNFYRAVYFLPVVTSMAVIGVVLGMLFNRVSASLPEFVVQMGWIKPTLGLTGDPKLVMPVIIAVGIWHTLGLNMVNFMAALQSVPKEMYEAATVDGAGHTARFWYITVPMIRPVGTIILFLAIIGSLGVFDIVWVLTKGGPFYASDVVSTYVYSYSFSTDRGMTTANFGYASAAALFMSMLVLGLTIVQVIVVAKARRKNAEFNSVHKGE